MPAASAWLLVQVQMQALVWPLAVPWRSTWLPKGCRAQRSFNADSDNIRGIAGQGMQSLSLYYNTPESREGVAAFNEKRKPDFRKFAK